MLTTKKFLSCLSPLTQFIPSLFLHFCLFFPTGQTIALTEDDLSDSYEVYELSWGFKCFSNFKYQFSKSDFFENNHYVFSNQASEILFLSDRVDATYLGSEVFNNNTSGPDRYLIFHPNQTTLFPGNFITTALVLLKILGP